MRPLPILVTALAFTLAACSDTVQAPSEQAEQPDVRLRFQSAFPAASLFYRNANYFTDRVAAMSSGRLQIEMMAPGAVVPAFEVLDAVHDGILDGGHAAPAYWVGRNRTATLFGPAPGGPFGMDMLDYMGWMYESNGLELYREFYQQELRRNVVPIPMTAAGNQILGWFRTPVKSWEDLRGRKCRQTGITAEVFSKSGMQTVNIPGGEIVPAGQRGVIDCGEWVGPAEDMIIGFHTIWKYAYMPSIHEPATVAELLINGRVWEQLPQSYREIVKSASIEATLRSQVVADRLNAEALIELREQHGVSIERTPDDILANTLKAWDEIAAGESASNPFFKKVYDSQRAYAGKVVPGRRAVHAPYELGANYYWPDKK
ncbi:MAG TPA: TRAP transporter substrate-binding protein [Burkholderiales bacterium]|nr:TRAP transporter substrate-binding protein [Burkholderiales bacterium]